MLEESKELLDDLRDSLFVKKAEYHEAEDEYDANGIWIELDDPSGLCTDINWPALYEPIEEEVLNLEVITISLSDERLTPKTIYNSCVIKSNLLGFQYSNSIDTLLVFVEEAVLGVLPLISIDYNSEDEVYDLNIHVKNLNEVYTGSDSNFQGVIQDCFYEIFKAISDCTTYTHADGILRCFYQDYGCKYDEGLYDSILSKSFTLFEDTYDMGICERRKSPYV